MQGFKKMLGIAINQIKYTFNQKVFLKLMGRSGVPMILTHFMYVQFRSISRYEKSVRKSLGIIFL